MADTVNTEIWVADLEENIYPNNSFIQEGRNDDDYIENKTVNLPQAGAAPEVVRDRDEYPIPVAKRVDSVTKYDVIEFSTNATQIQYSEALEASYQKRQSILFDHQEQLKSDIARFVAHKWAPTKAANIIKTTGDSRTPNISGLTGSRKAISKYDLAKLNSMLDLMDVPSDGRVILIDGGFKLDLNTMKELGILDSIGTEVLRDGTVSKIMGFKPFTRSSTVRYSNDNAPQLKAEGSALVATDRLALFAWHPMFVRRALGTGEGGNVKVFIDIDSSVYQGDVISALSRCGASKSRFDERGIVGLVEEFA